MPSDPSFARARGQLLRTWRETARRTRSETGAAVNMSPQAVAMWEGGDRGKLPGSEKDKIQAWDTFFTASNALLDMWLAIGTPDGVRARPDWAHNYYDASGGPVWVWLRTDAERVQARFRWGPTIVGTCSVSPGPGRLVIFPASAPSPALTVDFVGGVGWADFGRGLVPEPVAAALRLDRVSAVRLLTMRPGRSTRVLGPVLRALDAHTTAYIEEFGESNDIPERLISTTLGFIRPSTKPIPFQGLARLPAVNDLEDATPGLATGGEGFWFATAEEIQELRQARGFGRDELAQRMRELSPSDVKLPTTFVEMAEGRRPGDRHVRFLARLDFVLAADGHLGIRRFSGPPRESPAEIRFPQFWVGPVWLHLIGDRGAVAASVDLVWGKWRRIQADVPTGTVLTARKVDQTLDPLVIVLPAGWTVVAGTGHFPGAYDINDGWRPRSVKAAARVIELAVRSAHDARHLAVVHDHPPE